MEQWNVYVEKDNKLIQAKSNVFSLGKSPIEDTEGKKDKIILLIDIEMIPCDLPTV